jgi:hypothetical protein
MLHWADLLDPSLPRIIHLVVSETQRPRLAGRWPYDGVLSLLAVGVLELVHEQFATFVSNRDTRQTPVSDILNAANVRTVSARN